MTLSAHDEHFLSGYFASIRCMIRSAVLIASEIMDSKAGDCLARSSCASLRAASMVVEISNTRLRPSLTDGV